MAASDAIASGLAAVALVIVARRIGRGPLVILSRRLIGSLPLRPLGAEPGVERWFALGGVTTFVGLGIAALASRLVGYSVTALGMLAVAYTGGLIALDHRGAARAFVRRAWADFGVSVREPVAQMRVIGVGMFLIAIGCAVVVMREAFR